MFCYIKNNTDHMCRLQDYKSVVRETYSILSGANDGLKNLQERFACLQPPS
jgi:hypothetical protein